MPQDKSRVIVIEPGKIFLGFEIDPERVHQVLEGIISQLERPEDPKVQKRVRLLNDADHHTKSLSVLGGHYKECELDQVKRDEGLIDLCIARTIELFQPRKPPLV